MICPIKNLTVFIFTIVFLALAEISEANPLDAVFPANNATDVTYGTISLTWETMENATYKVSFGTNASSMSQVSLSDSSLPMADVSTASGTTYYWQVTGTNASGDIQSSVWRFATAETETGELDPVYPTNNATEVPYGKITLRWKASQSGMLFDLYFGKDASSCKKVASNLSDPLYDVDTSSGREYLWWVVARNSEGAQTISSVWSFTTKGDDSINGGCNLTTLKCGTALLLPLMFLR